MSWQVTGLVSRKRWGGQTRRLMALTMADKANDDGSGVYASVRTMARDAEISEATARRTLREFEDAKLITKTGERACSNGYTNIYQLNTETITALDDLKDRAHSEPPSKVQGVSGKSPKGLRSPRTKHTAKTTITATGGSQRAPTGLTVTDNPILDPSSSDSNESEESCANACGVADNAKEAQEKKQSSSKAKKPRAPRPDYTAEFDAFWKSWPRKRRELSDKRTAARRWSDARKRFEADVLIGASKRYLGLHDVAKDDHRYCVLAEVFLNGKLDASVEAYQAGIGEPADMPLERRLEFWTKYEIWQKAWGPRPGEPGGPPLT